MINDSKVIKMKRSAQEEEGEYSEEMELLLNNHDDAPAHVDSEGVWLISYADMMTLLMGFFALMTSMASFDNQKFEEASKKTAEFFGGEVEKSFDELGKKLKDLIAAKGLKDKVSIVITPAGVEMVFEGTMFFESGSVQLKDQANELMQQMTHILDENAKDKKFVIEGHTDDNPIHAGLVVSNWELSGLRASAVTHIFEEKGFPMASILTIGWGETRPLFPNKNPDGTPNPLNQTKNRRVVIKIMNKLPM